MVDLSDSMNSIDLPPDKTERQLLDALRNGGLKNRLDIACTEIERFVNARPNDRIGLIVFADLPYVICPPTLDHPFLLANLNRLKAGSIGSKTGIASPLASAVNRLRNSESKSKIIILFTDGVNNVNALVSPKDAARLAEQFDVRIYTVGIGGQRAVTPYMGSYAPVQNSFDEELLQELSSLSGGRYYKAEDAEGMAQAMADINQLERNTVEQNILIQWKEWYPQISVLAAIFLMFGLLLRETFCLRLP